MDNKKNKDDLFRFVEYSPEAAERTGYSDYSYWKSVFQNFFKKKSAPPSGSVAKDRLKLVLVHDRVNCSSQVLEMLKTDIIKVISNYMEIDDEELDIQITQTESDDKNGTVPVLYANIPIKSMRKVNQD